jgi:hypothetical protein
MAKERAEEGEFKGYPTITIFTGKEYNGKEESVILGVRKAAVICDLIDQIRVFVEKHDGGR